MKRCCYVGRCHCCFRRLRRYWRRSHHTFRDGDDDDDDKNDNNHVLLLSLTLTEDVSRARV